MLLIGNSFFKPRASTQTFMESRQRSWRTTIQRTEGEVLGTFRGREGRRFRGLKRWVDAPTQEERSSGVILA